MSSGPGSWCRRQEELGNDLSRALTSELAMLASPLTALIFLRKYQRRQIKQYKRREPGPGSWCRRQERFPQPAFCPPQYTHRDGIGEKGMIFPNRLHIPRGCGTVRKKRRWLECSMINLFCSGHIVVLLIRARAFALLIAQGVICALGQQSLKLADQGLAHRLPLLKGIQCKIREHPPLCGRERTDWTATDELSPFALGSPAHHHPRGGPAGGLRGAGENRRRQNTVVMTSSFVVYGAYG